ncbi:hypothetical protein V8E36_007252 [Tilletia maclaganii]
MATSQPLHYLLTLRSALSSSQKRTMPSSASAAALVAVPPAAIVHGTPREHINSSTASSKQHDLHNDVAECITRIYEQEIKHSPEVDLWLTTDSSAAGPRGRALFKSRVATFVSRQGPISFVLPAFPCKSSNQTKVSGTLPDKGEDLAFRTILTFIRRIEEVYPPGAVFNIVSDGHVFADLIGVDDEVVTSYSTALRQMGSHLERTVYRRSTPAIAFHSLGDLLEAASESNTASEAYAEVEGAQTRRASAASSSVGSSSSAVKSAVGVDSLSQISSSSEDERNLLMSRFGSPTPSTINGDTCEDRSDTNSSNNTSHTDASLLLYRGFSRFLLEDIGQHPVLVAGTTSTKQRKNACSALAKIMIQRNGAYSTLVDATFPEAVRCSIHPHDNAGPQVRHQPHSRALPPWCCRRSRLRPQDPTHTHAVAQQYTEDFTPSIGAGG